MLCITQAPLFWTGQSLGWGTLLSKTLVQPGRPRFSSALTCVRSVYSQHDLIGEAHCDWPTPSCMPRNAKTGVSVRLMSLWLCICRTRPYNYKRRQLQHLSPPLQAFFAISQLFSRFAITLPVIQKMAQTISGTRLTLSQHVWLLVHARVFLVASVDFFWQAHKCANVHQKTPILLIFKKLFNLELKWEFQMLHRWSGYSQMKAQASFFKGNGAPPWKPVNRVTPLMSRQAKPITIMAFLRKAKVLTGFELFTVKIWAPYLQ